MMEDETSTMLSYSASLYANLSTLLDVEYWSWIWWLFKPVLITFILPGMIYILLYISIIILYFYRFRHKIRQDVQQDIWHGARTFLALLWWGHARIYHGYEMLGLENIPSTGPALLIYYHGAIPIDYYYLLSGVYLYKQRLIWGIGDRFLQKLPGFHILMEVMKITPGSIPSCVESLNNGNLLAISPGGVFEALFGTHKYQLLWRKRVGFAKVALEAKVPIIPIFTQNLREAFRSFPYPMAFFLKVYELTKLPLVPLYGGFPVKLRTIVGKPIAYDSNLTPEKLAEKTKLSIEDLIMQHQRIPGSILKGIIDRFDWLPTLLGQKTKRRISDGNNEEIRKLQLHFVRDKRKETGSRFRVLKYTRY
ncbi:transmembrane protein 68-like isoform X2 [Varroa jacobsoni]|uniref:Phospholipid/glycerol acyltransferase domain-containing protein n=1 Tax=Varroa destructor TaxID=109461 RepID=A0A7M7JY50_VARDE|nr:transmembrane protein 68-like isoform X2 [Varroa destructor]XP_022694137.1 transmembrane protein 68-like isoform X2 [Varroa jacobsoni]